MGEELVVRPAAAGDYEAWLPLWQGFCRSLGHAVADAATNATWRRIVAADQVFSLLALDRSGDAVGMANCVVHPHTWSPDNVCYLEDLFVAEAARGGGVGRALIEALVGMGKERSWRRVYWHTHADNVGACKLYDRLAKHTDYVRYEIDL